MALELDSEHKYRLDGRLVPGFSEIARDMGILGDTRFMTEAGRNEGTALHEWCDFYARGNKSDAEPDARIAPRVAQFLKFLEDSKFKLADGEKILYHPTLKYCGKPDAWGWVAGRPCVIDYKGGAKQKWHPLQLSAYKLLLAATFPVTDLYTLYLDDANYRLSQVELPAVHELNWKAIVAAYHAKAHYTKGEE